MTHVTIVGAGLLGSALAFHLARRGAEVTVVEADRPGRGTSSATFAFATAQDKMPAGYFELNEAGVREYAALAATLGPDWRHPGGDLVVGCGAGAEAVAARIERYAALGYSVHRLDRAALAALEPAVEPAPGELAVAHFPDDVWIDVPLLVGRLLAGARAAGAVIRTGQRVESFEIVGDRVSAVRLAGGELASADVVVLAAGPETETLAASAGVRLPMKPSPGLLAITEPIATGLGHVVHAEGIALRPDGGGRIILFSRAVDGTLAPDVRTVDRDAAPVREIVDRGAALVPALAGVPAETVRIGRRALTTDGQPAVGFAASPDNLYLLTTHSGVTLGGLLGRLAASEILGRPVPQLEPYRPSRFAVQALEGR
jgi:glycine/D-amino acid oxidase-like deaminating enzyme